MPTEDIVFGHHYPSDKKLEAAKAKAAAAEAELQAAEAEAAAGSNIDALRASAAGEIVGSGGGGAQQDPGALAGAMSYVPTEPTPANYENPLAWAYTEFVKAGLKEVSAPNGPLERWGPQLNMHGGLGAHDQWVPALLFVIKHYQEGTDNINKGPTDAENAAAWEAAKPKPAGDMSIPVLTDVIREG